MAVFQGLYDKNKYVRSLAQKLGFARPLSLDAHSPRIVEYPWTLRNVPSAGKVLDVGSSGSQLPIMLVCLGYNVWTFDVRKYEYADVSKNLHSISGDIRKTEIATGFFDIVTAVSTIEHIGLGRYGDAADPEGDRNAMKEIKRIMASNGTLLMTVPFGKRFTSSLHRVYDTDTLYSILEGFKIQSVEFFVKTNQLWIKADSTKAGKVDSSEKEGAVACVKATIS